MLEQKRKPTNKTSHSLRTTTVKAEMMERKLKHILVLLLGHINPIQREIVNRKRTEGFLLVIVGIIPKLSWCYQSSTKTGIPHIHHLVNSRSQEAGTLNSLGQEISKPNDQHHPSEKAFQVGQKWGKQPEANRNTQIIKNWKLISNGTNKINRVDRSAN